MKPKFYDENEYAESIQREVAQMEIEHAEYLESKDGGY